MGEQCGAGGAPPLPLHLADYGIVQLLELAAIPDPACRAVAACTASQQLLQHAGFREAFRQDPVFARKPLCKVT